jgi:hypothetical protein
MYRRGYSVRSISTIYKGQGADVRAVRYTSGGGNYLTQSRGVYYDMIRGKFGGVV